jgi:hypothetical protein
LEPVDLEIHQPRLVKLEAQMAEAFEHSTLPDEPTTFDTLDDYVVRARLELGQHGRVLET